MRGGAIGAYEVATWRVEAHMVYTNTVPCGHMRAPGEAQPMHAVECHMDLCARAMGIDPVELRIINAPRRPRETESGEPGTVPKAREALQAAAEAIGWERRGPGASGGARVRMPLLADPPPPTPHPRPPGRQGNGRGGGGKHPRANT